MHIAATSVMHPVNLFKPIVTLKFQRTVTVLNAEF